MRWRTFREASGSRRRPRKMPQNEPRLIFVLQHSVSAVTYLTQMAFWRVVHRAYAGKVEEGEKMKEEVKAYRYMLKEGERWRERRTHVP